MISKDLMETLVETAVYIIDISLREASSGNWIIYAEDIPTEIISPELYKNHINDIINIMLEHKAVADIVVSPDGTVDMCMYLAYCQSYEPFEDDHYIKSTLADRLDEGKRRAAQNEQSENKNTNRKQGLRE